MDIEPLSEELLVEIETDHAIRCPILEYEDDVAAPRQVHRALHGPDEEDHCDIVDLLAEVRRLQSAEQLIRELAEHGPFRVDDGRWCGTCPDNADTLVPYPSASLGEHDPRCLWRRARELMAD